jgi:hypothetical protein
MNQDLQIAAAHPFMRLAEANMSLITSMCFPHLAAGVAAPASRPNPFEIPGLMFQGLAKNYVEFLTALSRSNVSLFAGGRGSLVTLLQEQ